MAEQATQTSDKPKVPDKFMKDGVVDTDSLVASYIELEKKQGTVTPAAKTPEQIAAEAAAATPAGFSEFEKEYATSGKLSDASYAKLQKATGFTKSDVDEYIAYRQSAVNKVQTEAYAAAGGQEAYQQLAAWAKGKLTAAEIEAYDTAVKSGKVETIKLAVTGLRAKYERAEGRDGIVIGGSTSNDSIKPFANMDEAVASRRNPKYKTDPEYRKAHTERLRRMK